MLSVAWAQIQSAITEVDWNQQNHANTESTWLFSVSMQPMRKLNFGGKIACTMWQGLGWISIVPCPRALHILWVFGMLGNVGLVPHAHPKSMKSKEHKSHLTNLGGMQANYHAWQLLPCLRLLIVCTSCEHCSQGRQPLNPLVPPPQSLHTRHDLEDTILCHDAASGHPHIPGSIGSKQHRLSGSIQRRK